MKNNAFKVGKGTIKEERDGMTSYNDTGEGWKRDTSTDEKYAFDEISPFGLDALAKVCREGFKHGKGNWREHPQPEDVVMNHIMAHLNEYRKGDRSEDHLAKVAWGCFALIHYREANTSK